MIDESEVSDNPLFLLQLIPKRKEEKKQEPKLTEKIEATVKHLGEEVVDSVKQRLKIPSSKSTDDEDSGYESDQEDEPSLLEQLNSKIVQPASEAAHQLGEKVILRSMFSDP